MHNFNLILTVRFLGYILLIFGIIGTSLLFGPVVFAEANYRIDQLLGVKHTIPNIVTSQNKQSDDAPLDFSKVTANDNSIIPVSTEFGIVIEKIDANAKIIPDVNPGSEREYAKALSEGVAQALGSTPPGEPGNLYLFSHSTDAPWNIVRFNAIFYLLRELDAGDRVIVFYKNRRYDYIIFDKQVVGAKETAFLTNRYDEPVLTLQTCDPPGTLFNRLIVRAKLVKKI